MSQKQKQNQWESFINILRIWQSLKLNMDANLDQTKRS